MAKRATGTDPAPPALEFEYEPCGEPGQIGRGRLVLRPNGYPLSTPGPERVRYRGRELWGEVTWAQIERALGVTSPEVEWVREEVRWIVFHYVSGALPYAPDRLEWDPAAVSLRIVPGRASRPTAEKALHAELIAIERTAARLWTRLAPPSRGDSRDAHLRENVLYDLAIAASDIRESQARFPTGYVPTLLAVLESLPRIARWASGIKGPGRRQHAGSLMFMVWRLASLYEHCRGVPARQPWWDPALEKHTGDDFFAMLEAIAEGLPALRGTLGAMKPAARGTAYIRAFREIARRAAASGGTLGEVAAPLTVAALVDHSRRGSRRY